MAEQQQDNWAAFLDNSSQTPQTPQQSVSPAVETPQQQPQSEETPVGQPTAPASTNPQTSQSGDAESVTSVIDGSSGTEKPKSEYMPEVQLLSIPEVNMAEYNRRVNQYSMLPGESVYDMVMRNTPKPKTLDAKDEKRQKLFAALGDMGLLLSDAITVGAGGLVPKRGSAIASTMKAIDAEKARDAKALAEYNKLLREAMASDSKTKAELYRKGLAAGQAYLDSVDKARRSAEQFNVGQQNMAARTEATARASADRLERNIATRLEIANKRAAATIATAGIKSNERGKGYKFTIGEDMYEIPINPNSTNALQELARKAQEEDFGYYNANKDADDEDTKGNAAVALNTYSKYRDYTRLGGLSVIDAVGIIGGSRYFSTEEGKTYLNNFISKLNNQ